MNFKEILHHISSINEFELGKPLERRNMIRSFASKVAIASLPIALNAFFKKANAQTSSATTIGYLNFLLELEYFQYNYYHTGNSTGGLISSADQAGFTNIENHQKAHIGFLSNIITNLGGIPFLPKYYNNNIYCPSAYDFTSGGQFPVFTNGNYYLFLDLAQVFEDLFVRAYKGIIPNLVGNATALTAVVQMHSVEARHAAHVRLARRLSSNAPDYPKPWITNNISFNVSPVNQFTPYYNGEDNVIQGGSVDITLLKDATGTLSEASATESFDEPLDQTTVLSLINQFLL